MARGVPASALIIIRTEPQRNRKLLCKIATKNVHVHSVGK